MSTAFTDEEKKLIRKKLQKVARECIKRYGVRKEKKKLGFRRSKMNNDYVGSSFNDFLEEEGIATDVQNEAIKRLISYNLLEEMQKQNINKTEMAKKMSTSRAAG